MALFTALLLNIHLNTLDVTVIIAFLLLSFFIALYFRKKASSSKEAFFVGNRNLPWYVVGLSMVATTFAADTPLAVAELVGKSGISGNWLWWYALMGGMLTAVFFSHLWRRSQVITENEFISLRYYGRAAKWLRVSKAIYLGLIINILIMAWVNLAMITIFTNFFSIGYENAFMLTGGLMLLVMIYSTLSGFLGVVYTDVIQFVLAITASIVLAYVVLKLPEIGGMKGLKEQLNSHQLSFTPTSSNGQEWHQFLTLALIVWWASWYPGQEPGGGGYIAQRMAAAKNEKNATLATMLFQIAHICLRPWPWIIVGLACMILYPHLSGDELKNGYVLAMRDHLPAGLKGLMLIGFIGAYMSTISTHLNWGASYLVNDVYKVFKPLSSPRKEVWVGRLSTIALMILAAIVSTQITSISDTWLFIMECGAGLGLVLILRWYWWRINAQTEIAATLSPIVYYAGLQIIGNIIEGQTTHNNEPIDWIWNDSPYSIWVVVILTTVTWLIVMYLTSGKESNFEREHLKAFYLKIKPEGKWKTIAQYTHHSVNNKLLPFKLLFWMCSVVFAYQLLFLIGNILLSEEQAMHTNLIFILASGALGYYLVQFKGIFNQDN